MPRADRMSDGESVEAQPRPHDPAFAVRLRFGTHVGRWRIAVALIVAGAIALQLTSAYTLLIAVAGLAASVVGWSLVPAPGWRRTLVMGPAILGVIGPLGGALTGTLVALTLAAWLFVRFRPALSFVVVVIPIATGVALGQVFPQYGAGVVVASVLGGAVLASAWLAWVIAGAVARRRQKTVRPQHSPGTAPAEGCPPKI